MVLHENLPSQSEVRAKFLAGRMSPAEVLGFVRRGGNGDRDICFGIAGKLGKGLIRGSQGDWERNDAYVSQMWKGRRREGAPCHCSIHRSSNRSIRRDELGPLKPGHST